MGSKSSHAGPEGIEPPLEDLESPGLPLTYGPNYFCIITQIMAGNECEELWENLERGTNVCAAWNLMDDFFK